MPRPDDQPVSMLQGLQRILSELGGIMAAPDADIPFLTALQHAIVDQIKKATTAAVTGAAPGAQAAGQADAGAMPPQQIAPGGGGGMSGFGQAPGQMMQGGGASQMMGAPGPGGNGPSNPDELRRLLGANGQTA